MQLSVKFNSNVARSLGTTCTWSSCLVMYRTWMFLGLLQVRSKFARTLLGPFWIPLLALVTAGVLATAYSALWGISLRDYFPYVFAGLSTWAFISPFVNDAPPALVSQASLLKNTTICPGIAPLSVGFRNLLSFGAAFPLVVLLVLVLGGLEWWSLPLSIIGVSLVFFALLPVTLVVSYWAVRIPDLGQVIQPVMLSSLLITPVFWPADRLPPERAWLAEVNPFNWMVSVIRDPLLASIPESSTYLYLASFAVLTNGLAALIIRRNPAIKVLL